MKRRHSIRSIVAASICVHFVAGGVAGQLGDSWQVSRTEGTVSGAPGKLPQPTDEPTFGETSQVARTGKLPNDAGQVWREYDIRSFTRRSGNPEKPEQEIVDWILRETGSETWFGEPLSLLNANGDTVSVYHTPAIQATVAEVIERFVNQRSEANAVAVRMITVESPDWRIKAMPMLTPVATQTPGLEAWLISRENAALLLHELSRRTDYREHNSPNQTIYSGQTQSITSTRPRTFQVGSNLANGDTNWLGNVSQIEEGFSLDISPLVSRDGNSMDAVIKCAVDQVEGFTPLWVEGNRWGNTPGQRTQIQIPQISSWRLHERFRWPTDEVLLVSRGLVATPGPTSNWNGTMSRILNGSSPRANALLFLESRREIRSAARPQRMASRADADLYRGRY